MSNQSLHTCIQNILDGPWSFIQLRGTSLSDADIDGDDVDLLGSEASVHALFAATYDWAQQRLCHVFISARSAKKKCLVLYSMDGRHRLTFDLWIELPQLVGTKRAVCFDDFQSLFDKGQGVVRLPVDVEAALYLHHLVAKRKDLSGDSAQSRLSGYISACQGSPEVLAALESAMEQLRVSTEALSSTLDYLLARMSSEQHQARNSSCSSLLKVSRNGHLLTIMGCDGVGKTSLSEFVAEVFSPSPKLFKGKHLYRKSIIYKLAVIFIRPFLLQSREKFDEIFAPLVYLRASLGLRLKQLFHKDRLMIIDRSVIDFLYLNRKTDKPGFSSFRWLSALFGCRVPTVHCIASFSTISKRKLEMTEQGHEVYDRDMFNYFSRCTPTEYLLFNNDDTIEAGREALLSIIRDEHFPLAIQHKAGEDPL